MSSGLRGRRSVENGFSEGCAKPENGAEAIRNARMGVHPIQIVLKSWGMHAHASAL
jgi:hypothetical protein